MIFFGKGLFVPHNLRNEFPSLVNEKALLLNMADRVFYYRKETTNAKVHTLCVIT